MTTEKEKYLKILEDHKGILYKIANSYCPYPEDREDLIQEMMIQIWTSMDRYNAQFKWSTWIYRISLNTAISFYRKNRHVKDKTVDLSTVLETTLIYQESVEENPTLKKLNTFIAELKEIDKALILLYLDEIPNQEIAMILGISISNVSTKIDRIKKKLKKKFEKNK